MYDDESGDFDIGDDDPLIGDSDLDRIGAFAYWSHQQRTCTLPKTLHDDHSILTLHREEEETINKVHIFQRMCHLKHTVMETKDEG